MADHSGTAAIAWGALDVTAGGSDVKAGVVACTWGALDITVDTSAKSHDGIVICAWGE